MDMAFPPRRSGSLLVDGGQVGGRKCAAPVPVKQLVSFKRAKHSGEKSA
jgi:hypothetical protein